MAAGTKTDFVIYNDEFHTGVTDKLEQAAIDMGESTGNTIRLVTQSILGDFEKSTFFDLVEDLVQERDPTSLADVAPSNLNQSETINPKVNRRIGPHQDTIDKFKKINADPAVMSFVLGQQFSVGVMLDYLNTGLIAVSTAIQSEAGMVYDQVADADATDKTLSPVSFNKGMSKLGDAGQRIRSWVMHSAPYYKLIENGITEKLTGMSDLLVYGGVPGALGKPVYVSDSPALVDADPAGDQTLPAQYVILGLTEGALTLTQSEDMSTSAGDVRGKQNIVVEWQAEYAFNIAVKNFSYIGSGSSPTKAQLGVAANWNYTKHDIKSGPGVAIIVNI